MAMTQCQVENRSCILGPHLGYLGCSQHSQVTHLWRHSLDSCLKNAVVQFCGPVCPISTPQPGVEHQSVWLELCNDLSRHVGQQRVRRLASKL